MERREILRNFIFLISIFISFSVNYCFAFISSPDASPYGVKVLNNLVSRDRVSFEAKRIDKYLNDLYVVMVSVDNEPVGYINPKRGDFYKFVVGMDKSENEFVKVAKIFLGTEEDCKKIIDGITNPDLHYDYLHIVRGNEIKRDIQHYPIENIYLISL